MKIVERSNPGGWPRHSATPPPPPPPTHTHTAWRTRIRNQEAVGERQKCWREYPWGADPEYKLKTRSAEQEVEKKDDKIWVIGINESDNARESGPQPEERTLPNLYPPPPPLRGWINRRRDGGKIKRDSSPKPNLCKLRRTCHTGRRSLRRPGD